MSVYPTAQSWLCSQRPGPTPSRGMHRVGLPLTEPLFCHPLPQSFQNHVCSTSGSVAFQETGSLRPKQTHAAWQGSPWPSLRPSYGPPIPELQTLPVINSHGHVLPHFPDEKAEAQVGTMVGCQYLGREWSYPSPWVPACGLSLMPSHW